MRSTNAASMAPANCGVGKTLVERTRLLLENNIISKSQKAVLDELRQEGNAAAHELRYFDRIELEQMYKAIGAIVRSVYYKSKSG